MATQWFSNMVMDEPSFFHQWQSDGLLEQYTEQQIAVAFGQGEVEVDQALAAALMPLQQPAAAAEHRPRKAAKVNTSWDSCITEQGSPADSSSPTILSFGGHAAAAAFAKAKAHQVPAPPTTARPRRRPSRRWWTPARRRSTRSARPSGATTPWSPRSRRCQHRPPPGRPPRTRTTSWPSGSAARSSASASSPSPRSSLASRRWTRRQCSATRSSM